MVFISRVSLNRTGGNSLYPFLTFALYCSNGESEQSQITSPSHPLPGEEAVPLRHERFLDSTVGSRRHHGIVRTGLLHGRGNMCLPFIPTLVLSSNLQMKRRLVGNEACRKKEIFGPAVCPFSRKWECSEDGKSWVHVMDILSEV